MIVFVVAVFYYRSHEAERQWIWIYAIMAGYPSSLVISFLQTGGTITFMTTLLLAGTLQWGAVGVLIDAIVHFFRRRSPSPYI